MNTLLGFALIAVIVVLAMPMLAPRAWAALRTRVVTRNESQKRKR